MRNDPATTTRMPVWQRPSQQPATSPGGKPGHWSRYEKLSFSMLGYTWGVLVVVVTALHVSNLHRETRTSSTSGSHAGFHGAAAAVKSANPQNTNPSPIPPSPEGTAP